MKFEDEYKKELNKISPTEEQCERIRSGVAKKLADSAPVKKKKPIYLRIAAVSSICSAALIIVIFGARGKGISNAYKAEDTAVGNLSANEGENREESPAEEGVYPDSPADSANVLDHSYNGEEPSASDAPGDLPISGTSQDKFPPRGTDFEPCDGGGEPTAASGAETSSEPYGSAPASTDAAEPETGSGELLQILDGCVYLEFSEDNSTCKAITSIDVIRAYRLDKEANAAPLSADKALKVFSDTELDLLAQFEGDKMFIYFADGRIYNIYTLI